MQTRASSCPKIPKKNSILSCFASPLQHSGSTCNAPGPCVIRSTTRSAAAAQGETQAYPPRRFPHLRIRSGTCDPTCVNFVLTRKQRTSLRSDLVWNHTVKTERLIRPPTPLPDPFATLRVRHVCNRQRQGTERVPVHFVHRQRVCFTTCWVFLWCVSV